MYFVSHFLRIFSHSSITIVVLLAVSLFIVLPKAHTEKYKHYVYERKARGESPHSKSLISLLLFRFHRQLNSFVHILVRIRRRCGVLVLHLLFFELARMHMSLALRPIQKFS